MPDCGNLLFGSGLAAIGTDHTTPNRGHGDKPLILQVNIALIVNDYSVTTPEQPA